MPKLKGAPEEREQNRFCDWVRGEAKRQGYRNSDIADELLISDQALCNKLNGRSKLTITDISRICGMLGQYTFGAAG